MACGSRMLSAKGEPGGLGNASERHSINDYFHNLKHSILVLRINLGTGSRMFFKKGIFIAGFLDI